MKLVINDSKNKKSYGKTVEDGNSLVGKKIGEKVSLSEFGLGGYEAKIVGGSDKQGFPMKNDLQGTARRKVFLTENKKEGIKKRVSRAGNVIGNETSQVNLLVTNYGQMSLSELIAPEEGKKSAASIKEEMIKQAENILI